MAHMQSKRKLVYLTIFRRIYEDNFTVGSLYFNNTYLCDTKEGIDYNLDSTKQSNYEINKITKDLILPALPLGTYEIIPDKKQTYIVQYKLRISNDYTSYQDAIIKKNTNNTILNNGEIIVGEYNSTSKKILNNETFYSMIKKLIIYEHSLDHRILLNIVHTN